MRSGVQRQFGLKQLQRAQVAKRAAEKVEGIMQSLHVGKAMHTAMHLSRFIVRPAFTYGAELSGLAYVRPRQVAGPLSAAEQAYVQHLIIAWHCALAAAHHGILCTGSAASTPSSGTGC